MADKLKAGIAWLAGKLKSQGSQSVTYARGSAEVVLSATIGATEMLTQEYDVHAIDYKMRDYIVTATDLVLHSVAIEPEEGDQIYEADGRVFEVLPIPGGPCWRWSDPHHTMLRIHTKEVS